VPKKEPKIEDLTVEFDMVPDEKSTPQLLHEKEILTRNQAFFLDPETTKQINQELDNIDLVLTERAKQIKEGEIKYQDGDSYELTPKDIKDLKAGKSVLIKNEGKNDTHVKVYKPGMKGVRSERGFFTEDNPALITEGDLKFIEEGGDVSLIHTAPLVGFMVLEKKAKVPKTEELPQTYKHGKPEKGVPRTDTYRGEIYSFSLHANTQKDANDIADQLKRSGYKVRVKRVKDRGPGQWAVYRYRVPIEKYGPPGKDKPPKGSPATPAHTGKTSTSGGGSKTFITPIVWEGSKAKKEIEIVPNADGTYTYFMTDGRIKAKQGEYRVVSASNYTTKRQIVEVIDKNAGNPNRKIKISPNVRKAVPSGSKLRRVTVLEKI